MAALLEGRHGPVAARRQLLENGPPLQIQKATSIQSSPGAGPRHLCFSSNGKYLYVIEELTGSISVYRFYKGIASFLQKVVTHPKTFKGVAASADIHLSPDGLYLYASNRGNENNIVSFKVLPNGKLEEKTIQYTSTEGKAPRNFTISKDGNWLLAANQDSNNIIAFIQHVIRPSRHVDNRTWFEQIRIKLCSFI